MEELETGGYDSSVYRVGILDVEPTNRCNARCVICPRDALERPIGDMSDETFDKLLEALKNSDVKKVVFSGFGEPLLHKGLPHFVARSRRAFDGVIQLNTNASMLTKPLSSELVKAGLDIVNVSYNGPGREEYERVMRGMRFDQLKKNIRGFIEVRGSNPRPVLSLQSSMPGVENQKKEVLKIGSALGMEVVQFYAFNNRAGYLPQGLEINTIPLARRFCYKILFIAWDGTIYPCSHDIKGMQPLGNICRVSLDEVHKEDYPLCAPCTICGTQGLREHTIVKNVLRYKVRRLISWVYS